MKRTFRRQLATYLTVLSISVLIVRCDYLRDLFGGKDRYELKRVGEVSIGSRAQDIAVAGNYAYVCACTTLVVLSLDVPSYPTQAGRVSVGGAVEEVSVAGSRAYLAGQDGLFIVDVSDPGTPHLINHVFSGRIDAVAACEKFTFFVTSHEFYVMDNSSCGIIGVCEYLERGGVALAASGDYVYGLYVDDGVQLRVFDISVPGTPNVVSSVELGRWGSPVHGLSVAGNKLYAAGDCVYTLGITDPARPSKLDSLVDQLNPSAVIAWDSLFYFTNEPSAPRYQLHLAQNKVLCTTTTRSVGTSIAVLRDYVYVVNFNGELEIFQFSKAD